MIGKPLIILKGIEVAFSGKPLFSQIHTNVYTSELFTIVGPSGCGKTSLVLAIAGLLQPSSGLREFADELVESEIVYVPQQDALLAWRSLRGNIGLGLELHGVKDPSLTTVNKWASEFGCDAFLHKRVHQLSGGMRKRVCLARALCANPRVVLLDEPFNNLDFLDRHRVETFLRAWVAEERRAAICVTHDIEQAVAIGDRIGCFTRLPNASSSDPMCFEVLQVPDSLRKHSPSERWGRPEFHGVVEQIEQKFEHG